MEVHQTPFCQGHVLNDPCSVNKGGVSCVALKIQYDLQTFSQEVDCFFEMQNLNDRKKVLGRGNVCRLHRWTLDDTFGKMD